MRNPSDPISEVRWIEVKNTSDEDAPPHGLLLPVGIIGNDTITVTRPNKDSLRHLLVASPLGVPAGGQGLATGDWPAAVAAHPDFVWSDLFPNRTLGCKAGEWTLRGGYSGFHVYGKITDGLLLAKESAGDPTYLIRVTENVNGQFYGFTQIPNPAGGYMNNERVPVTSWDGTTLTVSKTYLAIRVGDFYSTVLPATSSDGATVDQAVETLTACANGSLTGVRKTLKFVNGRLTQVV